MIEIVAGVVSPEETDALAAMVELPPPGGSACRSMPYSVVDPTAGDVPRQLKYLLNQVRVRSIEIVQRATGTQRLYPASTTLRLSPGEVGPRGREDPDWWSAYKAVVPLDVDSRARTPGRDDPVSVGSLAFAEATTTWSIVPESDGPWLSVTITLTDQLEKCEL